MKPQKLPYEDEMKKLGFKRTETAYALTFDDGTKWTVCNQMSEKALASPNQKPTDYVPTKQSQRVYVDFTDAEGLNVAGFTCTFGAILTKTVVLGRPLVAVLVPADKSNGKEPKKRHAR